MTGQGAIAIIPARGGSVRMPRKNVADFMNKPLIHWTVQAAIASGCVDRTIVSTDDPEIAEAAMAAGAECPFLRPAHLATSEATTLDVVLHLLDSMETDPEHFVLMQPTSPLRFADDVVRAFHMMDTQKAPAAVSVCAVDKPWPVLRQRAEDGQLNQPPEPEGGAPGYQLNGAIYWNKTTVLRQSRSFTPDGCLGYVMSAEASVDIDTPLDFAIAVEIARKMPEKFA